MQNYVPEVATLTCAGITGNAEGMSKKGLRGSWRKWTKKSLLLRTVANRRKIRNQPLGAASSDRLHSRIDGT